MCQLDGVCSRVPKRILKRSLLSWSRVYLCCISFVSFLRLSYVFPMSFMQDTTPFSLCFTFFALLPYYFYSCFRIHVPSPRPISISEKTSSSHTFISKHYLCFFAKRMAATARSIRPARRQAEHQEACGSSQDSRKKKEKKKIKKKGQLLVDDNLEKSRH